MATRESAALPASGLAAIVAVLIGFVVVHETSLEKSRPGERDRPTYQLLDLQDAEARLWQDPFAAVQAHQDALEKIVKEHPIREASEAGAKPSNAAPAKAPPSFAKLEQQDVETRVELHVNRHRLESLQNEIRTRRAEGEPLRTVLAITVAGGPYTEDAEQRRRFRYAVLAALNQLGFAPYDGDHIGYIVPRASDAGSCGDTLPERMPYEWFVPKQVPPAVQRQKQKVLVLWLNEHALYNKPRAVLSSIAQCLGINGGLRLKLIGPATSDTLRALRTADPKKDQKLDFSSIDIYSAIATAPERAVPDRSTDLAGAPEARKIPIRRTIVHDGELAKSIVTELGLRDIALKSCDPEQERDCAAVALVSEWDTVYGQSLPAAIQERICSGHEPCKPVLRYSYLQGIDGAVPGSSPGVTSAPAARREGKDQTREAARAERAEGSQQFDYLRRLADSLKQKNAELRQNKNEIKAIGILGSDAYDKLLVLKALRRDFPRAVFFTTDLDSRLLHPEEFAWARNVVVASSFGLALRRELQGEIPQFRDTYQTSLFLSTMLALADDGDKLDQKWLDGALKPRIFEVGRRTAVGLDQGNPGVAPENDKCRPRTPLSCETVHPPSPPLIPGALEHIGLAIPLTALMLLLAAFYFYPKLARTAGSQTTTTAPATVAAGAANPPQERRAREALEAARSRVDHKRFWWVVGSIAVGLVLLALIHGFLYSSTFAEHNQEPFRIYEGVSVWPAELVRLGAAFLSVFFIVWGTLNLEKNQLALTAWFFPAFKASGIPVVKFEGREKYKRVFACDLLVNQKDRDDALDAEGFWRECVFHTLPMPRLLRTLVPAVLFLLFTLCLFLMWGFAVPPTRGNASALADTIVLFVSVIAFLALTFFVVDATLLCKRFIGALSTRHTNWPEPTRTHYGALLNACWVAQPGTTGEVRPQPQIEEAYDDWIDMRLIAARSAEVAKLVYYPLIVLLMLLFARSTLFDDWDWPVAMIVTFTMSFGVVIGCAVVLRLEAEHARRIALANIARRVLAAKAGGAACAPLAAQLEFMHTNVMDMREGAFAPFTQQPVVKAVLLFLSASGLALLEYFGVISI